MNHVLKLAGKPEEAIDGWKGLNNFVIVTTTSTEVLG